MKAKRKKSQPARRRAPAATPLAPDARLSEAEALLALAAPAVPAPSPKVKEQLLARIRASKAPALVAAPAPEPGWRFESVHAAEGWRIAPFPGVRLKTLSVDQARDVVLVLIEMAPGARFPDHDHEIADEGIVLSGDVTTGGRLLRAGEYYYAAAGTKHAEIVSPSGCTALVSVSVRTVNQWRAAYAAATT